MDKALIITVNGTTIEVPLTVSQIKFSAYIDYVCFVNREMKTEGAKENFHPNLIKALSYLVKGDLTKIPYAHKGDSKTKSLYDCMDDGKISLLRIDNHLRWMLEEDFDPLDPQNTSLLNFEHEGEQYYLQGKEGAQWITQAPFTVEEVMLVLDTDELIDKRIKEQGGDPYGANWYTRDLMLMAILCRKKNERLPIDIVERTHFIDKRAREFAELTMDKVLAVTFFLNRIYSELKRTIKCGISLQMRRGQVLEILHKEKLKEKHSFTADN